LPIAARKLIPLVGFKWALRIIGFIEIFMVGVAVLTLKRRLPPTKVTGGLFNLSAFRSAPYSLYVAASMASFLGLYTVLTYLDVSATSVGISPDFSFYLIPIANAASLIGRLAAGWSSDKFGPINTMIPSTLIAGVCTYAWPHAKSVGGVVVIAVIYGIACGVFVGILPAPIAQMGNTSDIGRRTGMQMTLIAFAAVAGPPISGAIRDQTGSFDDVGIYAGSVIMLCILLMIATKYAALGKFTGKF